MKITFDTKKKAIFIKDDNGNIKGMIQQLNEIFGEKWKQWDLTLEVPYTYFETIITNGKAEVRNLQYKNKDGVWIFNSSTCGS